MVGKAYYVRYINKRTKKWQLFNVYFSLDEAERGLYNAICYRGIERVWWSWKSEKYGKVSVDKMETV